MIALVLQEENENIERLGFKSLLNNKITFKILLFH